MDLPEMLVKANNGMSKRSRRDVHSESTRSLDLGPISSEKSSTIGSGTNLKRESVVEGNKALFLRAYNCIDPNPYSQSFRYLYSDRKVLIVYGIITSAMLIVWCHFFLIKYEEQKLKTEKRTAFYSLKLVVPVLEFGTMHSILFQMALLPLTMMRFSIAAFSDSSLAQLIPLNWINQIHFYVGYQMLAISSVAMVTFSLVAGVLCAKGEADFCGRSTFETMWTGYAFLGSLIVVGLTSMFWFSIPYELFHGKISVVLSKDIGRGSRLTKPPVLLAMHSLVYVLYAVAIGYTLAHGQSSFQWIAGSILIFCCNHFALRLNHCYRAQLVLAFSMAMRRSST